MSLGATELLAILSIGYATSGRGEGISLREALSRAEYSVRRGSLKPSDLLPFLKLDPMLVRQWLAYSEDKRTSGGWYVLDTGEIGTVAPPRQKVRFDSVDEAVAEFVVRELDFWTDNVAAG